MFLKRIEAEGFKSFATKTIISFPQKGLVGIVGPNGSGKSNINDSIKWVLGEQSAKSLRGSEMMDVVFAGSLDYKPANMCEVTLTFDNSAKILNSKYSEITVTRRLFKESRQNEYFINNEKCRLKDIRHLIMNTGLGKNSFSIVSQGTITKLAEAKPQERRLIFEEAAGVAGYREQKNEAIRKLDRTSQNLEITETTVKELERQLKPLEEQAQKAKKYLKLREELEEIEVTVIADELKIDTKEFQEIQDKIKELELEKDLKTNLVSANQQKAISISQKIIDLEVEIDKLRFDQNQLQTRLNEMSSSTTINEVGVSKDNISKLLEALVEETKAITLQIETNEKLLNDLTSQKNNISNQIQTKNLALDSEKYNLSKLKFEVETLDNQIKNHSNVFIGPKTLIQNKNLFLGIYDIVNNLIKFKKEYEIAISTALGNSGGQSVVVKNKEIAKKAITYLKEKNIGRATFLPLDVIKPKWVDEQALVVAKSTTGFIDIASNLIEHRSDIQPAILFLLGTTIIFDNLDNALKCSNLINAKYRIITLEGDVINYGNSITGGRIQRKGNFNLESKLDETKEAIKLQQDSVDKINNSIEDLKNSFDELTEQFSIKSSFLVRLQEKSHYQQQKVENLKNQYRQIMGKDFDDKKSTIKGESPITIKAKIEEINEQIAFKSKLRLKYVKDQQEISGNVTDWNKTLITHMDKLTQLKLDHSKLETRIGTNLATLNNDYKLTLDLIKDKAWDIDMSKPKAKSKVLELKEKISELGYVNVDALQHYEDIKQRYDEVNVSYQDLVKANETLLKAISELDTKMETQLSKTVEAVREKFQVVFRSIFNGGMADIKYSDPDNVLESGIEVIAKPPGKEIQTISLFSGGEKSMIAVTLIFAILQVTTIPLLILDEAEAALDEANVERYAKYCLKLNELSQVIVVTHRPGTMENCDVLYGVTMQQKGVTKLVSVKLEQAREMTN